MVKNKTSGKSHFVDEVVLQIKSGDGGNGSVSFRRERFIPKGEPNGGDGGKGGDVIVVAEKQLRTLFDLKYKRIIKAENGKPGSKNNRYGKSGKNKIIKVPVGSLIYDTEQDNVIVDLTEDNQEFAILKGGRGGKGNAHFKSSTNRSPKYAQPGESGEEKKIRIELKLLADIGLIGFPNVGKSSLVSAVTAAKPKISDYPFTTLTPNLGIVRVGEFSSFVICDIPGLIEGAHLGKGLGHQFLRHIERAKILACVVDISNFQPNHALKDLDILENELDRYNKNLWGKVKCVIGNKIDLGISKDEQTEVENYCKKKNFDFCMTSAVTHMGLKDFVSKLSQILN